MGRCKNMATIVIYKTAYGYKVTNIANYNKQYQDASKIIDCSKFDNPQQIVNFFVKYGNAKENDFIIIQ